MNDIFIIIGTISKVTVEFRDFDSELFTTTGLLLGFGTLLVYFGLLRYFGFFSQYNVSHYILLLLSVQKIYWLKKMLFPELKQKNVYCYESIEILDPRTYS